MIKEIHQITLKDVILLDATKSATHLKKHWFIPIYFLHKPLEKLAQQIFEHIGSNTIDDLENEFAKILSYRKLQILEALYNAVKIELGLKAKINVWKLILNKDYKESAQLEEVLAEVLKHTGIEIKTPEDLKAFEDHVEFKIDKHRENYPEAKQEEKKEVKLQKILYSVFNYMGEPYSVDMPFTAFVEMKELAEDRIKRAQLKQDSGKN